MSGEEQLILDYEQLDNLSFYSMLSILQGGMWLLNDIESFLRKYNFSHGRFSILLSVLQSREKMIYPVEIAQALGKSKPTITKMIEKLRIEGFIQVLTDSTDRRAKRLKLTNKSYKLLNKIIPVYNRRIIEMSSGLSDDDKYQLMTLVAKINFLDSSRQIMVKS
jgi:DNA-binding MarR family transcriptional regulator